MRVVDLCAQPRGASVSTMPVVRARSEMPEIPDVSAIAQQVKARIKHIEDQLKQWSSPGFVDT
jgi:hypothetical protein